MTPVAVLNFGLDFTTPGGTLIADGDYAVVDADVEVIGRAITDGWLVPVPDPGDSLAAVSSPAMRAALIDARAGRAVP